jgi:hypothetical protein
MRSSFEPGGGVENFIDAAVLVSWAEPAVRFLLISDASTRTADLSSVLYRERMLDRIKRLRAQDRIRVIDAPVDLQRLLAQCVVVEPAADAQDLADEIGRLVRAPDPVRRNYG